jgi:hypothetical protein
VRIARSTGTGGRALRASKLERSEVRHDDDRVLGMGPQRVREKRLGREVYSVLGAFGASMLCGTPLAGAPLLKTEAARVR